MNNLKAIPPFKGWVIQNFPFIEADFDAITEYQLLCKVVEYLNKVIANENQLSESMNYVLNFFNNLDVQDEINNKLDEMAESGQLTEIIAQYLQLAGLLCFNTKNDMKAAQNLVNGSFVKTFGTTTYNDGYGQFYKIRTLTSSDTIDNVNIIALTNYPTLIAELIHNKTLDDIVTEVATYTNRISSLEDNNLTELFVVGDSYTALPESNWAEQVAQQLHLNLHKHATSTMGYVTSVGGNTFINNLNWGETQNLRNKAKYLICYGGINDVTQDATTLKTAVENFIIEAKTLYPNAQIIIVGPQGRAQYYNYPTLIDCITAIESAARDQGVSYVNSTFWLLDENFSYTETYSSDFLHPSSLGYNIIASKMLGIISGNTKGNLYFKINSNIENLKYTLTFEERHIHLRINMPNVTCNNSEFFEFGNIVSNLLPYISKDYPLTCYMPNANYDFINGVLGYAKITNNGVLRLVNRTGSSYTGRVLIEGDIYFNGIGN